VARARRPEDWAGDVAGARAVESHVAELLRSDPRLTEVVDRTSSFDELDFSFRYRALTVTLDVKEKRQRYSQGIRDLWPSLTERDMFIVDETVFRRIVWQGGGGYLLIRDVPTSRWVVFGPWELTLGRKLRYARWGQRSDQPFLKGKLVVDLGCALSETDMSVDLIVRAIDVSSTWRSRVDPYPIRGATLPEIGKSSAQKPHDKQTR